MPNEHLRHPRLYLDCVTVAQAAGIMHDRRRSWRESIRDAARTTPRAELEAYILATLEPCVSEHRSLSQADLALVGTALRTMSTRFLDEAYAPKPGV